MAKQCQMEHTHALLVFRRLCWALLIPAFFCIVHAATGPNPSHMLLAHGHGHGDGDGDEAAIVAANKQQRQDVEEEIADYALRRLRQEGREVKTGMAYDVNLPSWTEPLRGAVQGCQVLKAKTGSLRRRGLLFNAFDLPQGLQLSALQNSDPTAHTDDDDDDDDDGVLMSELLLVYRRIHGDLNFTFYTLPAGYTFVSPVVGIATYTYPSNSSFSSSSSSSSNGDQAAINISALTEVQLMVALPTSGQQQSTPSITITVPDLVAEAAENQKNDSAEPLCASFFPNGSFSFSNLTKAPNVCSSSILTDTALVLGPAPNPTTTGHSAPPPDQAEEAAAPITDDKSNHHHHHPSAIVGVRLPPQASPGAVQHHDHHHHIMVLLLSLGGGIIGLLILITALIVSVVCCCCGPIQSSESDAHESRNHKTSSAATYHCPKLLHCLDAMAGSGGGGGGGGKEQRDEEDEEFRVTPGMPTTWIGHTRVPTVPALRTKPSIEVGSLQFPCKQ